MKALFIILICSSLAVNTPAQEKPQTAAGVGIGIAIICVGGVCVYIVAKKCQKWFPKNKPPSTNELAFVQQDDEDEYGASWNYGSFGSCPPEGTGGGGTVTPTTFVLNVSIRSESQVEVSMRAAADEFQDWNGFAADMDTHGLVVTGIPDGSQYFSRNRQPVDAGEVPIRLGPEPGTVTVSSGTMVKVVVERSLDLTTWETLLTVRQPAGTGFRVLDASIETHAFYRTRILP